MRRSLSCWEVPDGSGHLPSSPQQRAPILVHFGEAAMSSPQHWIATQYLYAGLSVIPIRTNGNKKPALSSWEPFMCRLANDAELSNWYAKPRGIGIVCGIVSGGLEVIDFDDGSLFPAWLASVVNITKKLTIIRTAGGGYHCLYRCPEIGTNAKIACDPSRQKATLIESRGQGGYIIAHGSPSGVHPSGRTYDIADESAHYMPTIPNITPGERRELWRAARAFDKRPPQQLESLRKRINGHVERHRKDNRPLEQRKESARRYVAKMEPSVSGCNGHGKAYAVAKVLVEKFGLPFEESVELFSEYNDRCVPKWNEKEIMHKLESAIGGKI